MFAVINRLHILLYPEYVYDSGQHKENLLYY